MIQILINPCYTNLNLGKMLCGQPDNVIEFKRYKNETAVFSVSEAEPLAQCSHLFSNFDSYTSSSFEKFIFSVFVYISS